MSAPERRSKLEHSSSGETEVLRKGRGRPACQGGRTGCGGRGRFELRSSRRRSPSWTVAVLGKRARLGVLHAAQRDDLPAWPVPTSTILARREVERRGALAAE